MGRMSGRLLAAAILVAFIGVATLLVSLAPEPESQEAPPQIPFVLTAEVESGPSAVPLFATGTVRPTAEVNIAPQVGGKVVWVDAGFRSGGHVRSGQVLFRIESEDYEYEVQIAQAELAARQVALIEVEEQASIAREQYERYAAQQGDADFVKQANPLALWEPQLNAARAALKKDQARVSAANLALSRTQVTAPLTGIVREESVDVGDVLMSGQGVARLFASDAVEVVVPLTDAEATLIPGLWNGSADQKASARVIARYGEGSYAWTGSVERGEAAVDESSRTVDVVVRIPEPFSAGTLIAGPKPSAGAPPLLMGKFVEVEITGVPVQSLLLIPRAALQADNQVWAVDDEELLRIHRVKVLQRANDKVYVTGSLYTGQRVITGGIQYASEGMRVRVAP